MAHLSEFRLRRLLHEHGYQAIEIRHGTHWRVRAERNGTRYRFTVPLGPRGGRFLENLKADLRRGRHAGAGHIE